jgi:alpha/beta superfamily hydrolase
MKKTSAFLAVIGIITLVRFAGSPSAEVIRNVDALLLFVSGFSFGGAITGLVASRRAAAKTPAER